MFRHIDLLPTLAEATGFKKRPVWLGNSLYDSLMGQDKESGKKFKLNYCECGHSNIRSIQSSRWKLIYNYKPLETSLYDLENDPAEKNSLDEVNKVLTRQLKEQLMQIERANRKLKAQFVEEGADQPELPAELLEQLRNLGYVK
jgi:arylsulfatase A-like enzyme